MREPQSHDYDAGPVSEYLEETQEELIVLARDLLGVDTQNPPGETVSIVEYIEAFLADLDVESERIVEVASKPNLVFSVPGESETTLLYSGHLDTVPYDRAEWTYEPLGELDGETLYGRGATDMKGSLAAMLHVVRAYVETETTPPVTLRFALVSDEETAGPAGMPALLDRGLLDAEACVIGETTCEAGMHSVTVADKGSIWLRLEATGEAAHGSRPPLGENAIDRLLDAVEEIRTWVSQLELDIDDDLFPIIEDSVAFYEPRMGEETAWELFTKPTVNLGTVEGGGTINRVPDTARAELDIRLTAGIETPPILAEIETILEDHSAVDIADVSWSIGTYEAFDSPLAEATSQLAQAVSGEPIYRRSATGGGDVKKLRNEGVPTIEFAFGTDTAHAADEHIPVEALQYNAAVYSQLPFAFASRFEELSDPNHD